MSRNVLIGTLKIMRIPVPLVTHDSSEIIDHFASEL